MLACVQISMCSSCFKYHKYVLVHSFFKYVSYNLWRQPFYMCREHETSVTSLRTLEKTTVDLKDPLATEVLLS